MTNFTINDIIKNRLTIYRQIFRKESCNTQRISNSRLMATSRFEITGFADRTCSDIFPPGRYLWNTVEKKAFNKLARCYRNLMICVSSELLHFAQLWHSLPTGPSERSAKFRPLFQVHTYVCQSRTLLRLLEANYVLKSSPFTPTMCRYLSIDIYVSTPQCSTVAFYFHLESPPSILLSRFVVRQ